MPKPEGFARVWSSNDIDFGIGIDIDIDVDSSYPILPLTGKWRRPKRGDD